MTERLAALLREEASRLDVPVPPVQETLAAGHRIRRRRTLTRVVAVAATVGVVGAVGFGTAALTGSDEPRTPKDAQVADPAPPGAADVGAVFSVGDTVYLDGGQVSATMKETVQAMYLTSAGVLVRTNKTGASDGGSPFHFALVRPDGTVLDLGLTLGEVVPATDPSEPYLAYAAQTGGATQAVVLDVSTGQEAARVDVPGRFSWGGWDAPPVALAGDLVYVGNDAATQVVDWRSGVVLDSPVLPGSSVPDVSGGRMVVAEGPRVSVVDAATGETVLDIDAGKIPYVTLSPDGRFAKAVDQEKRSGFDVYAVDSGAHVAFEGAAWDYGWTSDGDLFRVGAGGVDVCSAPSGECSSTPLASGVSLEGDLRLLGLTYES